MRELETTQQRLSELRGQRVQLQARIENVLAAELERRAQQLMMASERDALMQLDAILTSSQDNLLAQRERFRALGDAVRRRTGSVLVVMFRADSAAQGQTVTDARLEVDGAVAGRPHVHPDSQRSAEAGRGGPDLSLGRLADAPLGAVPGDGQRAARCADDRHQHARRDRDLRPVRGAERTACSDDVDESRNHSFLSGVGQVSSLFRSCTHGLVTVLLVAAGAYAQVPADTAQRPTPVVDTTVRRDTVITPRPDQARGVDAELRAALYDIATDRALVALNRLEFLRTSPVALTGDSASRATVNRRQDLLFLLAQTYYRLGVGERFRGAAQDILNASPSGRYAGLLRLQLMVDAYRRGDYARATQLSTGAGVATDRGLTALVAGLVSYNQGNIAQARTSFATAAQGGGPFAPYARYMDAISIARTDTSQTAGRHRGASTGGRLHDRGGRRPGSAHRRAVGECRRVGTTTPSRSPGKSTPRVGSAPRRFSRARGRSSAPISSIPLRPHSPSSRLAIRSCPSVMRRASSPRRSCFSKGGRPTRSECSSRSPIRSRPK